MCTEELAHTVLRPGVGCKHERGVPRRVLHIELGALADQLRDHIVVSVRGRKVQRGVAVVVLDIDLGIEAEQALDALDGTGLACKMQRGFARDGERVDFRIGLQQRLEGLEMASVCSIVDRVPSGLVKDLDVNLWMREQELESLCVAVGCRKMRRGLSLAVLGIDCSGRTGLVDENCKHISVLDTRGDVQGQQAVAVDRGHLGAVAQQQVHCKLIAHRHGLMQGGPLHVVGCARIGLGAQQQIDGRDLVALQCGNERGVARIVASILVASALGQKLHAFDRAVLGSNVVRCCAVAHRWLLDQRTGIKQGLHELDAAQRARKMQRGGAVFARQIRVCASLQQIHEQGLDCGDTGLAAHGFLQCCCAAVACRVQVDAPLQDLLDGLQIGGAHGLDKVCVAVELGLRKRSAGLQCAPGGLLLEQRNAAIALDLERKHQRGLLVLVHNVEPRPRLEQQIANVVTSTLHGNVERRLRMAVHGVDIGPHRQQRVDKRIVVAHHRMVQRALHGAVGGLNRPRGEAAEHSDDFDGAHNGGRVDRGVALGIAHLDQCRVDLDEILDGVCGAGACGDVQRGVSVAVLDIDTGALGDEHRARLDPVGLGRIMHGGPAHLVGLLERRARDHEQLAANVAVLHRCRREMQRGLAAQSLAVECGAVLQQMAHHVLVAVLRGNMQGCHALGVGNIDARAAEEQQTDENQRALGRGLVEGRPALGVDAVDLGAARNDHGDLFLVARGDGADQRVVSARDMVCIGRTDEHISTCEIAVFECNLICGLALAVRLGALRVVREQNLDRLVVADARSNMQRSVSAIVLCEHIGFALLEQQGGLLVLAQHSEMQRGHALEVLLCKRDMQPQKQRDCAVAPCTCSRMDRIATLEIHGLGIRAALEQNLNHIVAAHGGRKQQRGVALGVGRVHIGAVFEQQRDGGGLLVECCQMQCRAAIGSAVLDALAVLLDQLCHASHGAMDRSDHERGLAVRRELGHERRGLCEQQCGAGWVFVRDGIVQRREPGGVLCGIR
eukprot:comp22399_c0_seq2/m.54490 comp22399_c0_seq2/g.54490  ORF comp22399_c0_seq2/g.54490 comp22399_c0_seq2/m.54490 type:complete len:1012 (+) comp22399_c0_seq2:679-3714(+)